MKTITLENNVEEFRKDYLASGTSLQLQVDMGYEAIEKIFGMPDILDIEVGNGNKVQAEWHILTPYGIATIYNYKDGKNYIGDEGLDTQDITDWHIGAHDKAAAETVQNILVKSLQA